MMKIQSTAGFLDHAVSRKCTGKFYISRQHG